MINESPLVFADHVLYSRNVPLRLRLFSKEVCLMRYPAYSLVLIVLVGVTSVSFGQGKGVDSQNQRITDTGNSRAAGNNGTKQDTGTTGSGINFGKDKTRTTTALPNPYRITGRRDVLLRAVADVMRDRKLIVDDGASKPREGIIISQPYTFIKGAVVTQSELSRFARIETADARAWTRARYTITIEVQAIDGGSL